MPENDHARSLPAPVEAENAVHAAEQTNLDNEIRNKYREMWIRRGYTPEQADRKMEEHDQRTAAITDAMQSAATDTPPSPPDPPHRPENEHIAPSVHERAEEPPPSPRAVQPLPVQTEVHMRMPGAFSRALSTPVHWIKALGLSTAVGGGVFLAVSALVHYLFSTTALISWASGIPAVLLAVPAFLAVLSAAAGEIREWVRLGGPSPLHWRD